MQGGKLQQEKQQLDVNDQIREHFINDTFYSASPIILHIQRRARRDDIKMISKLIHK